MPAAEVEVSPDLVRRLLTAQHPDIAQLPVVVMANGWDNVMCRLGEQLVVRLPRREAAVQLIVHEQKWLPVLQPRLPLPIPAPVRVGRPGFGFPWPWSVVPLLPGQVASRNPPTDMHDAAVRLGEFLGSLHLPAPPDAPKNPVRGIPLVDRWDALVQGLDVLGSLVDRAAVMDAWEDAVTAAEWRGQPVWLHGDLHPANILVHYGRVSAVIDFGDITAGDPATDLAVAWMLLPAQHHDAFREAYHEAGSDAVDDDHLWTRARGWALALAIAFLAHSADNAHLAGIGHRTLKAVLS